MKYIFLHGLGQTPADWYKTLDVLENRANAGCPDLFSLINGQEINFTNLYREFSEYCRDYDEPLALCGLSLGGILALQYGIENPDKVHSAVLIGTQYVMPKKLLKIQNAAYHIMPGNIFKNIGLSKKDVIALSKSMIDLDFRHDLHKVQFPVLIVCGEKDKFNMQASLRLAERIKNAEFVAVKNGTRG